MVLPTKNEEEAISGLIDEIHACGYTNLLAVDGQSTDRTVKVAEERGVKVVQQTGKGKRDAVVTALRLVDTPYCVFMDADMSYDPRDIDLLLEKAEGADQVVGVRRPQPDAMSRLHRVGNRLLTRVYNLLFGTRLFDVLSGMYLLDTDFARNLELSLGEFTVEQEILAQSTAMGRVEQVSIGYRKRVGVSKVHTWSQGLKDLVTMLSIARRYSPVVLFGLLSAMAIIPATVILAWVLSEALGGSVFHEGYATLALLLFVIAAQGFAVSAMSLSMKLTLRQFERRLRRNWQNPK